MDPKYRQLFRRAGSTAGDEPGSCAWSRRGTVGVDALSGAHSIRDVRSMGYARRRGQPPEDILDRLRKKTLGVEPGLMARSTGVDCWRSLTEIDERART
jgi:hypothetical protein